MSKFAFPKKRRNSQLAQRRESHTLSMASTMIAWKKAVDQAATKRMTLKIRAIMITIRIELANIYTHRTIFYVNHAVTMSEVC